MAGGSRLGETFSHFFSAEFDNESEVHLKFRTKLKGLQNLLMDIPGIGKAVKGDALHITLGVLHLAKEEVHGVTDTLKKIWEQYMDILGAPKRLALSFRGIEFGDRGSIWVKMELGKEAMEMFREMLVEEVGEYVTDMRFETHLTIFRSSEFSEDLKDGISGSASRINLGCTAIRQMSLRPKKTGKTLPEPVLTLSMEEGDEAE